MGIYSLNTSLLKTDKKGQKMFITTINIKNEFILKLNHQTITKSDDLQIYINKSSFISQNSNVHFPEEWFEYVWNDNKYTKTNKIFENLDHISVHPNNNGKDNARIHIHFDKGKTREVIIANEGFKLGATYINIFVKTKSNNNENRLYIALMKNYSDKERKQVVKAGLLEMDPSICFDFSENELDLIIQESVSSDKVKMEPISSKYLFRIEEKYDIQNFLKYLPLESSDGCIVIGPDYGYSQRQSEENNRRYIVGYFKE